MAMTAAEKILARASGRDEVAPGEYVTASIDKAMCNEGFAAVAMNLGGAGVSKVFDPERVVVIMDHYVPPPTERAATIQKIVRGAVSGFGLPHFYDGRFGIAHQVMMEQGHALPGELIVGTDSHTCTYGALGAASCGIGFTEMAYALATGKLWFRVPETVRFRLEGELQPLVMSKDVILKLAGDHGAEVAQYRAAEFSGSGAQAMSMASRMTISNMSMEIGAKFCFFETDGKTGDFLSQRAGDYSPLLFDESAVASAEYELDLSGLEPQVAVPHAVENVRPVSALDKTRVDQALLGSCTNGRLEDLRVAASILKGRKVHPDVRLLVFPASWSVYGQALEDGTLASLLDAGAIIMNSGCGPCFGSHGGLLAQEEVCVASTNRNFIGRMGSDKAGVYLASPATVAASAALGYISDPREL